VDELGHLLLDQVNPPVKRDDHRNGRIRGRRSVLHDLVDMNAGTLALLDPPQGRREVIWKESALTIGVTSDVGQDDVAYGDRIVFDARRLQFDLVAGSVRDLNQPAFAPLTWNIELERRDETVFLAVGVWGQGFGLPVEV